MLPAIRVHPAYFIYFGEYGNSCLIEIYQNSGHISNLGLTIIGGFIKESPGAGVRFPILPKTFLARKLSFKFGQSSSTSLKQAPGPIFQPGQRAYFFLKPESE